MADKTYKEIQASGEEITQELQEVTEENLKAIPDMTKDSLEDFGRTHLGVEVDKGKSHKNISKDILALAQKKYDECFVKMSSEEEEEQPNKNIIVVDSDKNIPDSFLKDPNEKARTKAKEISTLKRLAERHGYTLTPVYKDMREIPTNHTSAGGFTHLKNTNTGNIFKKSDALKKLPHMAPCDKKGNRVF
jgi:hypothetical protein